MNTENENLNTHYAQRMRELTLLYLQKKEDKRKANYMRPQGGVLVIKNQLAKAMKRENDRVQSVMMGLMRRYCEHHGITFPELQAKVAEDYTAIEQFYQEALELIPERYHPRTSPPPKRFIWTAKQGPYLKDR